MAILGKYQIYVRDFNLQVAALLDDYISLEFTRNFNTMGFWELKLKFSSNAAQTLIAKANDTTNNKGKTGILVIRNGSVVFSGPVRLLQETWDVNGQVLTASGPDDLAWCAMRYCIPVTGAGYTQTYASQYASSVGFADAVIKGLARNQFGASAFSTRQFSFINIAANASQGYSSVPSYARFDNLLEEMTRVSDVSESNGSPLGISCLQNLTNTIDFNTYVPVDKSASVVFSPTLGNVREYEFTQTAGVANVITAGDGGTSTARNFQTNGNGTQQTQWGVTELFVDGSQTTSLTELSQFSLGELQKNLMIYSVKCISNELVNGMLFQTNWNIGDKVSFQLRGVRTPIIVRSVKVELSPDSEVITPTLSNASGNGKFNLFKTIKNLKRRTGRLENF